MAQENLGNHQNRSHARNPKIGNSRIAGQSNQAVENSSNENLLNVLGNRLYDLIDGVEKCGFFQKCNLKEFTTNVEIVRGNAVAVTFVVMTNGRVRITSFGVDGEIYMVEPVNTPLRNIVYAIIHRISMNNIMGALIEVMADNDESAESQVSYTQFKGEQQVTVNLCSGWTVNYKVNNLCKTLSKSRYFCKNINDLTSFVALRKEVKEHIVGIIKGVSTEKKALALLNELVADGLFKAIQKSSELEDRNLNHDFYIIGSNDRKIAVQVKTATKCNFEVEEKEGADRILFIYLNKETTYSDFSSGFGRVLGSLFKR